MTKSGGREFESDNKNVEARKSRPARSGQRKIKNMKNEFDITKHVFVPKQVKLNEKERKELFEKYHLTLKQLPKILDKDPSIQHLDAKEGEVIKIVRNSRTAGTTIFYRRVTHA